MAAPSLRVIEADARFYRRTWRASVFSNFLTPVLYLLAMGVGLGQLIDEGRGGSTLEIGYLTFLAPGLLAAIAMQTAAGGSSYPVMAGMKWRKTYHATLATPVGIRNLVVGHLGWVTLRVTFSATVFALVMWAFGATSLPGALLAIAPAILTGVAFAAAITAYTARLEHETGLVTLFRFGIMPLFLFSGTFFPIEQLPDAAEPFAYVTPLWHGVSLCRSTALDLPLDVAPAVSVAYLLVWVVVGTLLSIRFFRRRLVL
jgi:lipooligosaccharide transport system permease protein